MVTGKKAFEGKSQASLIGEIMGSNPPSLSELQPLTPPLLDRVVSKCLAKESDERWQTARDLHDELKWIAGGGSDVGVPSKIQVGRKISGRLGAVMGLSLMIGAIIAGIAAWNLKPPPTRSTVRFEVSLPPLTELTRRAVALSPDGENLVYAANEQLYLRAIDELEATPMPGTEGAHIPFFSPDGQWVGFGANGELQIVPLSGGTPLRLCSAQRLRGAAWGLDDMIVFSDRSNIYRVPATGGEPFVLISATEGELNQGDPEILPEGNTLLFTILTSEGNQIVAQSLDTNERSILLEEGSFPRYLPTGHLIYLQDDALLAVPFDPEKVEAKGIPVPLVRGVQRATGTQAHFSVSRSGGLVYTTGGQTSVVPAWIDRQGNVSPLPVPATEYWKPSLSPDGGLLALSHSDVDAQDIWVYDFARGSFSRLTFFEGGDWWPVWSPDGRYVTFGSNRAGAIQLFRKRGDGSGETVALTQDEGYGWPSSWSPDGKTLVLTRSYDLWTVTLDENDRPGSPQRFLETPFMERDGTFSPDGRWLAYTSDESGRWEVYVRPFPKGEGKWQVSIVGGRHPIWAREAQELFFRNGDKMMLVDYTINGDAFRAEPPRELFTVPTTKDQRRSTYDVTADGQRFIVLLPQEDSQSPAQLVVVLNWFEELERLVPIN
jgi:serine/threonine-protein kinase